GNCMKRKLKGEMQLGTHQYPMPMAPCTECLCNSCARGVYPPPPIGHFLIPSHIPDLLHFISEFPC
ncbi:hypothetical protein SK128_019654, partial [Halocaridina rubra]